MELKLRMTETEGVQQVEVLNENDEFLGLIGVEDDGSIAIVYPGAEGEVRDRVEIMERLATIKFHFGAVTITPPPSNLRN